MKRNTEKPKNSGDVSVAKKDIKLRTLAFIALGGTVGGPIYVILGGTIKTAGSGVLISLLLLGILLIFLVMNYSELSLSIPTLGGGYSFSKEAIGGFWGFIIGWLMWLGNITFAALSGIGFGYSLAIFFPDRSGIEDNFIPIIGFAIVLFYVVLNLRKSQFLSKLMQIFTSILIFGFIFYIFVGLGLGPIGNARNFDFSNIYWDFNIQNISTVIIVSPILIGIFCLYEWSSTFESITVKIEGIKKARNKIPRAFLIAIIIGFALYIMVTITTLANMGNIDGEIWSLISNSLNPLADTLKIVAGDFGMYIIAFAGLICTMTSLQASMQMSYRIFFAMVRDGYLPKIFIKKDTEKNIPTRAKILSLFLILISTFIPLNLLVDISNFSIILTMGFLSFSVILLRKQRPLLSRPYKIALYPFIPLISGIICFVLIIPITPFALIIGIILLIIGIFVYSLKIARRDRITNLLTGTKIACSFLMLFLLFTVKNDFSTPNIIIKSFIEFFDGSFLIFIGFFSLITVFFDLKPLGLIIRQITKRKNSDATVVSEIVEITDEKKKLIFKINVAMSVSLIIMGIILFVYGMLFLGNNIIIKDNFLGITDETIVLIGTIILLINATVLFVNGFIGLFLQLELKKVNF